MGHGPSLWGGCCRPGWVGGQLSQRECLSCSSRRHEVWVHLWSPVQAEIVIKPTRISAGKSRLCHKDCCCLVTQLCLILCAPWNIAHQVRFLCPCDFPGKNTGVGCHFLLQGIFLTQGLNLHFLPWQEDSLPLSHLRSPATRINTVLLGALTESVTGAGPEPGCCTASLTQRPPSTWGALASPWGSSLCALSVALTPACPDPSSLLPVSAFGCD